MPWTRKIGRAGILEYIRGNTGSSGAIDRTTLVSGEYNPVYSAGGPGFAGDWGQTTCGYYGPTSLTAETEGTNLTYSTNGQTITGTAFYRRVSVTGQNITFVNCIFYGTPTDATSPVTCSSASVNTTFIDCTFAPMAPQYNTYCARVGLGGGTFLRCDFYGGSDGVSNGSTSGWPQRWTFTQCAFHDMLYLSPDPDAAGGLPDNASHTDNIQWGGGQLKLDGCGLWGFYDMTKYQAGKANTAFGTGTTTDNNDPYDYHMFGNKYVDTIAAAGDSRTPAAVVGQPSVYSLSNVMFSPIYRTVDYFEMTKCYIDGSTYALNAGNTSVTFSSGNFIFTDNKIGTNHRWTLNGGHKAIIIRSALHGSITISGNTDLATGAALSSGDILQNG